MSIDRRKTPRERRRGQRIAATFAVKQSTDGKVELCQAEDISPGGMAIRRLRERSQSPGRGGFRSFDLLWTFFRGES